MALLAYGFGLFAIYAIVLEIQFRRKVVITFKAMASFVLYFVYMYQHGLHILLNLVPTDDNFRYPPSTDPIPTALRVEFGIQV
jgi:hypothetical protein